MNQLVLVQTEPDSSVPRLLTALGAKYELIPLENLFQGHRPGSVLILSGTQLVAASQLAPARNTTLRQFLSQFRKILVYPFAGTERELQTLSSAVGGQIGVRPMSDGAVSNYFVRGSREMCGPFTGLHIESVKCGEDLALTVRNATCDVDFFVTGNAGSLLTGFRLEGVDLFVISSAAVFDVSAEYHSNLNIAECFSGLAPLLFFLRASQVELPRTSLCWANWIIDDPNLTPSYGFLNIRELAQCVRETEIAVSIAFIPWNHKRTSREIVALFRSCWPQLSICLHGCDHTGSEFSTRTISDAVPLVDLAMKRMRQLERDTSLGFDKVIVFPQGVFSRPAMQALRTSDVLAAVNTELKDCEVGRGVTGADLLQPAIMSFGDFPLFMRRRAEEPVANFALDLLLGKPCLIVTHHQYFEHGLAALKSVVTSLNTLQPGMVWTNLENGISQTYSILESSKEGTHIRLYGARTIIRPNMSGIAFFTKAAADLNEKVQVIVNEREVASIHESGILQFKFAPRGTDSMTVEVRPLAPPPRSAFRQSPKHRFKVMARRYLAEIRDNYLDKSPRLRAGAVSVRRFVVRH